MADPSRQNTTYTWDPVSASWVHERGDSGKVPPVPPDVHALQTYFWDPDSRRWVRTLLGPIGQQLAAKWPGAHREPDVILGTDDETKIAALRVMVPPKKSNPLGAVIIAVVLIGSLGGAALVASQQGQSSSLLPTTSAPPSAAASGAATAPVAASVPTAATPAPATPAPATPAPATNAPAPTQPPVVTRAPTAPPPQVPPSAPYVRLPEGTTVYYTGTTNASHGGFIQARFTVIAPNGRPATGELTIILGDITKDPRIVSGTLDAQGKIALDVPATLAVGQYPLSFVYRGSRAQIATVTIR